MENNLISWETLEYKDKDRSVDWFWAVGIITLAIIIISVIQGNYLFAIFIFLAVGFLMFYVIRKPEVILCEVNERGILIDNVMYLYSEIENFWIKEKRGDDLLLIKTRKQVAPIVSIGIKDEVISGARSILSIYVPEKEIEESLPHKIMDLLGF